MNIRLIAVGARPWEYLVGHWGISFLLDQQVLFDTFASFRALHKRLQACEADLELIRTVVISHDHWDHIGGLWELLALRRGLQVYLPPQCDPGMVARVQEAGSVPVVASAEVEVQPNVWISAALSAHHGGHTVHEQSLILKTPAGLVILAGCAHPGIAEIARRASQQFGSPVHAVLGGFHLMHSGSVAVRQCAQALKQQGVTVVAPTHCTGWRAERELKAVFGENCIRLREGQLLTF